MVYTLKVTCREGYSQLSHDMFTMSNEQKINTTIIIAIIITKQYYNSYINLYCRLFIK